MKKAWWDQLAWLRAHVCHRAGKGGSDLLALRSPTLFMFVFTRCHVWNWTSRPTRSLQITDDTGGEPGGPGWGVLVHVGTSGYCVGAVSTLSHVYFTFCLLFFLFPHFRNKSISLSAQFHFEMTNVNFRTDFQLKYFFPADILARVILWHCFSF